MREIGRLIRKAREAAGLSQQAASVRAGFKPAALGHWERGSRGIHATDLQRVAVALGVDVRALYPEPPPPRSVVITGRWAWLDPEGSGR
jgi:transcriptional regulator with XRE-family HTH domain